MVNCQKGKNCLVKPNQYVSRWNLFKILHRILNKLLQAFAFIKDYKTIVNNLRNTSNRLRRKARRGDAVVAVQDVQAWTALQVVPRGGVCGGGDGSGLGLCGGGGGRGNIVIVLIVVVLV